MFLRIFVLITFLALTATACKQSQLTGNWSRLDSTIKFKDIKFGKIGDLTLNNDSTFIIHGDTTNSASTIAGWHGGDEYRGVWGLHDNNSLVLHLEPQDEKNFVHFKIVRLTKNKLVLKTASSRKNHIIYNRK